MTTANRQKIKAQGRRLQEQQIAAKIAARDLSQENGLTTNVCQVQRNWQFSDKTLKSYQHPDAQTLPAIADWLSQDYIRAAKKNGYELAQKRLADNIKKVRFSGFNCCWPDEKIKEFAQVKADKVMALVAKEPNKSVALFKAEIFLSDFDICPIPCDYNDLDAVGPILARYECQYWWRRQLRKLQFAKLQQLGRDLSIVSYIKQPYCPDLVAAYRNVREGQNRELIEAMVAVANFEASDMHWINLADAVDASTSNPMVKAAELMVRMRGFEEFADEQGHVGEFVTITAPSRFHSINKNGQPNRRYVMGITGREAQAHLQANWVKCRALLAKYGIKAYGFRVVEPHHEGCPHWHMLMFMRPEQVGRFRQILRKQALKDSPQELAGNPDIRIKFKPIDKRKGSAAGYIAKYITKGVNGYNLKGTKDAASNKQLNLEAFEAAKRIKANLTANGIRQFQQVGGPPISVWRELRRLGKALEGQRNMAFKINDQLQFDDYEHFILESIRRAADSSDWKAFVIAMGGIEIKQKDRPARLSYRAQTVLDKLTGQTLERHTRYGEVARNRISGVDFNKVYVCTRNHEYMLMRKADLAAANQKIMSGMADMFDALEEHERYQAMVEDEYERFIDMMDQHESEIERMWILAEQVDLAIGGAAFADPANGDLDLCH